MCTVCAIHYTVLSWHRSCHSLITFWREGAAWHSDSLASILHKDLGSIPSWGNFFLGYRLWNKQNALGNSCRLNSGFRLCLKLSKWVMRDNGACQLRCIYETPHSNFVQWEIKLLALCTENNTCTPIHCSWFKKKAFQPWCYFDIYNSYTVYTDMRCIGTAIMDKWSNSDIHLKQHYWSWWNNGAYVKVQYVCKGTQLSLACIFPVYCIVSNKTISNIFLGQKPLPSDCSEGGYTQPWCHQDSTGWRWCGTNCTKHSFSNDATTGSILCIRHRLSQGGQQ